MDNGKYDVLDAEKQLVVSGNYSKQDVVNILSRIEDRMRQQCKDGETNKWDIIKEFRFYQRLFKQKGSL